MSETILEVRGLRKVFSLPKGRSVEAVHQVSFDVQRGEIFGFLGPNGAGKTTTIRMMTTQVRPTSGEVILAGESVWKNPERARRRFSIVPQHNNLDRGLTARENLLFHARYFGLPQDEAAQRAEHLLSLMGLGKRANDPVSGFSGGMAQRLKIARALMHDPEILFLDEPTTGLDPQSRVLLWEEIKKLNREGKTIFLTTHYLEEPEHLCDRVAILHQGELKALDTPARLKELVPSQNVVSIRLAELGDKLLEEARNLPEVVDAVAEVGTLRLYLRTATPDLGAIVEWLRAKDSRLLSMNMHFSTLNDVFVHLTGRGLEER